MGDIRRDHLNLTCLRFLGPRKSRVRSEYDREKSRQKTGGTAKVKREESNE